MGGVGACSDPEFPPGEPMKGVRLGEHMLNHDDSFRYIRGNITVNSDEWKNTPCERPLNDPLRYGGASWVVPTYHYDDFFSAMVSTFTLSLGGWRALLDSAVAFSGPEVQPDPGGSPLFMVYVLLGVIVFGLYFQA